MVIARAFPGEISVAQRSQIYGQRPPRRILDQTDRQQKWTGYRLRRRRRQRDCAFVGLVLEQEPDSRKKIVAENRRRARPAANWR